MTKKEFRELFLQLTQYTVPYGKEEIVEQYLPTGYKKDSTGNYYYEIGESKTMFTAHLDTVGGAKSLKVNHVTSKLDPYKIGTDGTTILGGDNKLGCAILIGMIKAKIPGVYYFFLGEEYGCIGSNGALDANPDYFKKFERAVAFDRREYGSIVTSQTGMQCCSPEFEKALAQEMISKGLPWDPKSAAGVYTDTATFMYTISECTNISAGGFNEHRTTEWADLNYTYNVLQAAMKIKWEELPVARKIPDPAVAYTRKKNRYNYRSGKAGYSGAYGSYPAYTKSSKYNKQGAYRGYDRYDYLYNDETEDWYDYKGSTYKPKKEYTQPEIIKIIEYMFILINMNSSINRISKNVLEMTFSYNEDSKDVEDFKVRMIGSNIYLHNMKIDLNDLKDDVGFTFLDDDPELKKQFNTYVDDYIDELRSGNKYDTDDETTRWNNPEDFY